MIDRKLTLMLGAVGVVGLLSVVWSIGFGASLLIKAGPYSSSHAAYLGATALVGLALLLMALVLWKGQSD